jgi:hypothetical protein
MFGEEIVIAFVFGETLVVKFNWLQFVPPTFTLCARTLVIDDELLPILFVRPDKFKVLPYG